MTEEALETASIAALTAAIGIAGPKPTRRPLWPPIAVATPEGSVAPTTPPPRQPVAEALPKAPPDVGMVDSLPLMREVVPPKTKQPLLSSPALVAPLIGPQNVAATAVAQAAARVFRPIYQALGLTATAALARAGGRQQAGAEQIYAFDPACAEAWDDVVHFTNLSAKCSVIAISLATVATMYVVGVCPYAMIRTRTLDDANAEYSASVEQQRV